MAAPHSPLPSIATPATKPPSTYTRSSNDTDRQLVGGTPVRMLPVKDEAKVRFDDMRERGVEVAEARRYPGKTKWGLLLIFSVSQYMDVASRASAVVFINDISKDLGIGYETSTWMLNSYGVTFGSFLLLWGRVSDIHSAKPVFSIGLICCGSISLIISFMTVQYAFYVFRALYGIAAAATIPSAFRLILAVFEPHEVQVALAMFVLSGALANATGLLIGGLTTSLALGLLAYLLCPSTERHGITPTSPHFRTLPKWKQLDIPGSVLILASLLLLNIGLTLGASHGFDTARFLVPFILSWPPAIAFFFWERKVGEDGVLPPSIWQIPNMALMAFVGFYLFALVGCAQLVLVERYQQVFGESSVKASVRLLPQGLAMCLVVIIASRIIQQVRHMRFPIGIAFLVAAAAYIPWIYGDGNLGGDYWKYYVPAFIVGSGAMATSYLGVNITIMTSVPPTMAGIAGALFQVSLQTGAPIGYSIQAGLLTIHPGSIANFDNIRISFWFQFGWGILCGVLVLAFFKPRIQVLTEEELREDLGEHLGQEIPMTETKSSLAG